MCAHTKNEILKEYKCVFHDSHGTRWWAIECRHHVRILYETESNSISSIEICFRWETNSHSFRVFFSFVFGWPRCRLYPLCLCRRRSPDIFVRSHIFIVSLHAFFHAFRFSSPSPSTHTYTLSLVTPLRYLRNEAKRIKFILLSDAHTYTPTLLHTFLIHSHFPLIFGCFGMPTDVAWFCLMWVLCYCNSNVISTTGNGKHITLYRKIFDFHFLLSKQIEFHSSLWRIIYLISLSIPSVRSTA